MRVSTLVFFTALCSIGFFGKSDATIDLSGVDLSKFQYFKDTVEAKMMAKAQQLLAPLTDKIEKAKAVATYFKNLALGNSEHTQEQIIEFDPNFGEAWQPYYEHHFGPRGARLIEVLGHGHSPRELHKYGALHRKSIEY